MRDANTPDENLSPEKHQAGTPRERRRITKAGPPSRAELEGRRRMLEEYKRAREARRQGENAARLTKRVLALDLVVSGEVSLKDECTKGEACQGEIEMMTIQIDDIGAGSKIIFVEESCDAVNDDIGMEEKFQGENDTVDPQDMQVDLQEMHDASADPPPTTDLAEIDINDISYMATVVEDAENIVIRTVEDVDELAGPIEEVSGLACDFTGSAFNQDTTVESPLPAAAMEHDSEDCDMQAAVKEGEADTRLEIELLSSIKEETADTADCEVFIAAADAVGVAEKEKGASSPLQMKIELTPTGIAEPMCAKTLTTKSTSSLMKRNPEDYLLKRTVIQYYCKRTDSIVLERIPKPHLRLFKISQVEKQLACGMRDLAGALLSVITAPGQLKSNDARIQCVDRVSSLQVRLQAGSSADELATVDPLLEPTIALPAEPKPGHFSGSDSEEDECGSRLAQDVEEASRRHSIILSMPATPRCQSVQKAGRMLMEAGLDGEEGALMASVRKRLEFDERPATELKRRRLDVDLTSAHPDEDLNGSTVKYALLTPSKRIQELLHTDLVVSPVRRSHRHLLVNEEVSFLYEDACGAMRAGSDDNGNGVGYVPNPSLTGSPFKTASQQQKMSKKEPEVSKKEQ